MLLWIKLETGNAVTSTWALIQWMYPFNLASFQGFLFSASNLYSHFHQHSVISFHLRRGRQTTVLHFRIQSVLTGVSLSWPPGSLRSGRTCNSYLSVSPLTPVAMHSQAVSTLHAETLCLAGNVIHFRRQTVVRCVGEREAAYWAWWMEGHRDGQPWYIHERTDEP